MSPRRKQSTKDLGAILSEAVPVVVAEEVQLPAGSPLPHPAEAEAPSEEAEVRPEPAAEAAEAEEAAPEPEAAAGAEPVGEPQGAEAQSEAAVEGEAAPRDVVDASVAEAAAVAAEPVLGFRPELRSGSVALSAEAPAVLWRKSTIPFREDQYAEIGHVLADFFLRTDVQLTIAEVVRLGLDKMIEALKEPELREALLIELYRQQRRESLGNENLKHSKSRGLGDYLAARGRLPAG